MPFQASIRGGLAVSWQMWTAWGIFLGFVANLVLVNVSTWTKSVTTLRISLVDFAQWRLQLGSAFAPTVPLVLCIFFCPESPPWHMRTGSNYRAAFLSLCRLRNSKVQAARELYYSYAQQQAKSRLKEPPGAHSFPGKVLELFTIPRNRRAALASAVVMIAQMLSGVNLLAFYSSTVLVDGGLSERTALLGSCMFGLVMFLFAWPAVWTMDTFGRRWLLLATFPHLAWTMLAAGLCFKIPVENPLHVILISVFFLIFTIVYSPGAGMCGFLRYHTVPSVLIPQARSRFRTAQKSSHFRIENKA